MKTSRLVFLHFLLSPSADALQVPRFEPAACPFEAGAEILGQVRCGYLVVRENRSATDGVTLRLAVAILKSPSPAAKPDPVVWLAGGPGTGILHRTPAIIARARGPSVRDQRDLILIDQRGTGYSQPRFCPDVAADVLTYPGMGPAERRDRMRAEMAQCSAYMAAAGTDLSQYNAVAFAHDLEDLRRTLGYSRLNLLGHSYGTRVALEALRTTPAAIRSVILNGPAPPNLPPAPVLFHEALSRLLAACATDAECGAAFPEVEQSFLATVDDLEREPYRLEIVLQAGRPQTILFDTHAFANLIFGAMYDRRLLPLIPLLIREVRNRNKPVVSGVMAFLVGARMGGGSPGLNRAVTCFESAPRNDTARTRQMRALPRALQRLDWDTQWWPDHDLCRAYHSFRAPEAQKAPVTSATPALVITGEYDPISHRWYGPLIGRELPNAFVVEIPGGGHSEGLVHDCTAAILVRFIDEPAQAPDRSCLAAIPRWRFATDVSALQALVRR